MTEPQTVIKLDPSDLNPMQREVNRGLMVAFINAKLLERATLDVRWSIVFYDASKTFAYAWNGDDPTEEQLAGIYEKTSIRFYSKGC